MGGFRPLDVVMRYTLIGTPPAVKIGCVSESKASPNSRSGRPMAQIWLLIGGDIIYPHELSWFYGTLLYLDG